MPTLGELLPSLSFLDAIVQDNTLAREYLDALFPELLFRLEATPERWEANLGDRMIFTRASLLSATPIALTPGVEPAPENPEYEQWEVQATQYGKSIDTHLPSSRTALASIFARNGKTLGLSAGQVLNRLARNKLYFNYLAGDTLTTVAAGPTTSIQVAAINGFTETIKNGKVVSVSPTNTKTALLTGVGVVTVTGATPADPSVPLGPGTVTVAAPVTYLADARLLASDASTILRAGNVPTIDGLNSASVITFAQIRDAIAILRRNRVPPHEDGFYHAHLDPIAESQLFGDNELQRSLEGLPDDFRLRRFAVGVRLGCVFFSNNESPNPVNTGTGISTRGSAFASPELFAEVRNKNGVSIVRTIITGGGAIMEKYIDESSEYVSEGGIQGKIGAFSVVNNSIQVPIERTRYIIRAPQDRLQQMVSQSWSASLDFGIPSDLLSGQTGSRFKRAIVIESATSY